jgi:hypothetical protein
MMMCGQCQYGDKCKFAHGLQDQRLLPIRQKVYDLLNCDKSLGDINLLEDTELCKCLIQLTTTCFSCLRNECQGGYNCKNGAISKEYTICYYDLRFGRCSSNQCEKIHLTKRGLINFKLQELIKYNPNYKRYHVQKTILNPNSNTNNICEKNTQSKTITMTNITVPENAVSNNKLTPDNPQNIEQCEKQIVSRFDWKNIITHIANNQRNNMSRQDVDEKCSTISCDSIDSLSDNIIQNDEMNNEVLLTLCP